MMDINLIAKSGWMVAGCGTLWQGATVDSSIMQLPKPFILIEMAKGIESDQWIDSVHFLHNIEMSIEDSPSAVLNDDVYLTLNDAALLYMLRGFDVASCCGAGISRSSYKSLGILIAGLGISTDEALTYLRLGRPQANPNSGFLAHVRALEARLLQRHQTLSNLL